MTQILNIPNISLIYQFCGAIILGWAIALTPNDTLKSLSGTYWNHNPHFLAALIKQRTDARFGVIVLAMGILLQLIENLFCVSQKISPTFVSLLGIIFICLFLSLYVFGRRRVNEAILKKLRTELESNPGSK